MSPRAISLALALTLFFAAAQRSTADELDPQTVLDAAALAQQENVNSIQKWVGKVEYTRKVAAAEPPLKRVADFAIDQEKQRYFRRVVREMSHPQVTVLLDGLTYHGVMGASLRVSTEGAPSVNWDVASDIFEPLGVLAYEVASLRSTADFYRRLAKMESDVRPLHINVVVENGIVICQFRRRGAADMVQTKKWDLAKGANIIELRSEHDLATFDWVKMGESWLPSKIHFRRTGPQPSDFLEVSYHFVECRVNEEIPRLVFEQARDAAAKDANVYDVRTGVTTPPEFHRPKE